jgi:enamine deaminase RidA (YjgF/YER057c/UK114 family)
VIRRINLPDLHQTPGYHHATITDATQFVFLSGQRPLNARGELTGDGDLWAQVRQVARNIGRALTAVGATAEDVVRTVVYVASEEQDDLAAVRAALRESAVGAAFGAAGSLVGVLTLGHPGQLVEVDVTVALR